MMHSIDRVDSFQYHWFTIKLCLLYAVIINCGQIRNIVGCCFENFDSVKSLG